MNPADATREIGWNISAIWLMYVLLAPTLVVAGYGLWRHIRLWRCGQPALRFDCPVKRLAMLFKHALLQMRTALDTWIVETGDLGQRLEPPEVVTPFEKEMHDWFGTPEWYQTTR